MIAADAAAQAIPLGTHVWPQADPGAGGYSAIWLDATGTGMLVLSDRGAWVRGQLLRDAAGRVAGVVETARGAVRRSTGEALTGLEADAEAIAVTGGAIYVAFEHTHRVMRHDDIAAPGRRIPQSPAFAGLQDNSGLEALAADAAGRLYAIPERSGGRAVPFPVFRFDGTAWTRPFALRRDGRYLVAGADIGPDGRLYLLERDFLILGFRTRVRSFDLSGGDERTVLESGLGVHDNLEGLHVWRDDAGRIRLTMVSDDNLRRGAQRTEIVEYVLP